MNRNGSEKHVIGLLGGIASGKSTVARMIEEEADGVCLVNADDLAAEALEQPDIREQVKTEFGAEYVTGDRVNRSMLADLVFDDEEQLKTLNSLVHPYVLGKIQSRMQDFRQHPDQHLLVLDVPLLVETDLHHRCDTLLFLEASEDVRFRRVSEERGWTREELRRRQSFQADLDLKRNLADHTIQTDQSEETTRRRVRNILSELDNPYASDNPN